MRARARVASAVLLGLLVAGMAAAQEAAPDTTAADAGGGGPNLSSAGRAAATQQPQDALPPPSGPLFVKMVNKPVAGFRANVRDYVYYGELTTAVDMRGQSQLQNTFSWSLTENRKEIKRIRRRNDDLTYMSGRLLPFVLGVDAHSNWSEDDSEYNLIRRDLRSGNLTLRKSDVQTGALRHQLSGRLGVRDETSENRGIGAEQSVGVASARIQTAWDLASGVILAGRVYGEGSQGTDRLREREDDASARGDTLGAGAYYDRGWLVGLVEATRSDFDSRFLDWRRGQTGAVDTLRGPDEPRDDQIVKEKEIRQKTVVAWENDLRVGRVGLGWEAKREYDETAYAERASGTVKKADEYLDLEATWAAGRDSVVAGYGYRLRWDDQDYRDGSRRGRQDFKDFSLDVSWFHRLFRNTQLRLGVGQNLNQQIPDEVRDNGQNRDKLTTDASVHLDRSWTRFSTGMIFGYVRAEDVAISAAQSIQNNVKENYELAPSFNWDVAPWLRFSQKYKLWIQYTRYDFPDERRQDNYNKRGNLNTFLRIRPTERLELTIEHDYNRRFNASQSGRNAEGSPVYLKEQIATINNIDFSVTFAAAKGVVLEASTYRKKDTKEFPLREDENTNFSGEIWVGARVNRRWGPPTSPLTLAAMVKKYNAYGPSVLPTSRDYWEADVSLKWSF